MARAALLILFFVACESTARAQDAFEIQVYDSETARRGGVGLELHVNNFVAGTTHASDAGELPTNHVTHLTLEPHLGLSNWCEIGGYLQAAIREDGHFDYAGIKLRVKARIPRRFARGLIGLALNLEVATVPATYEANIWSAELRPVIDLEWKRLYFSVNPIVGFDLAGAQAGRPQFQPAAKLAVSVAERISLGVEYYAAFGPLTEIAPLAGQSHRLFLVLDLARKLSEHVDFDINLGAGANTVGTGDRWIVKTIVGISY